MSVCGCQFDETMLVRVRQPDDVDVRNEKTGETLLRAGEGEAAAPVEGHGLPSVVRSGSEGRAIDRARDGAPRRNPLAASHSWPIARSRSTSRRRSARAERTTSASRPVPRWRAESPSRRARSSRASGTWSLRRPFPTWSRSGGHGSPGTSAITTGWLSMSSPSWAERWSTVRARLEAPPPTGCSPETASSCSHRLDVRSVGCALERAALQRLVRQDHRDSALLRPRRRPLSAARFCLRGGKSRAVPPGRTRRSVTSLSEDPSDR